MALLESRRNQDRELGNHILSQLQPADGTHTPITLFVIHQRYQPELTSAARQRILQNLAGNLPISARVRYADGNVNHPIAAYANMICAGELLEMPAYVRLGTDLLREFHQTISSRRHKKFRQAEMAEYNSPTYTALTLWFLAVIAEFAQNTEARELALLLEQRLWVNVAMHWHEPTQQFAGPYSRAYAEDSVGGFSALHCTFSYALEREVLLKPELATRFAHPSALVENAFLAALQFHVPPAAHAIACNKPLPYHFRMTTYCEQYHENWCQQRNGRSVARFDDEVYPGGWGELTTYLTPEYCLGTASRPYVNAGQSDGFSLRYRRAQSIRHLRDFRGAYTRMAFNGALVGQDNHCHVTNSPITKDLLYEEGRAFTYQQKNVAIVSYHPKRAAAGVIHDLRLDVIFSYHAPFDTIRVDGITVTRLPFETTSAASIVLADFRTYIALLPLPRFPEMPNADKVRMRQVDDHFIISFYNYQGEPKQFTREQLSAMRNGLVCLVATQDQFATVEQFIDVLSMVKLRVTDDNGSERTVQLRWDDENLCFRVDHRSERILERSRNGQDDTVDHFEIDRDPREPAHFYPASLYTADRPAESAT